MLLLQINQQPQKSSLGTFWFFPAKDSHQGKRQI